MGWIEVKDLSSFTSASRKEGQPCDLDSARKSSWVRSTGAVKSSLPVFESK